MGEPGTIPAGARRASAPEPARDEAPPVTPEQHSLRRSVFLHLAPGAALFLFVLALAPLLGDWAIFALFGGIGLVIVPLELGYLLREGRRKHGRWTLEGVVNYDARLSRRQYALWGAALAAWFIVLLALSVGVLDEAIADALFSWLPESIRDFAAFEDDADASGWLVAALLVVAFAFNGIAGPIVEELYFRGHLLPRIDRLGRRAPVLNAVLFSLYHLWTPWQNPGRIVALLPWIYVVWRKRSVRLSIIVHVTVNLTFLLFVLAVFL